MSNTSLLGSYGGQAGDGILFRNRIVNGDMRIAQRGNVALVNNSILYGGCDRTFVVTTGFTTATGTAVQGAFTGSTSGKGQFASGLTTTGTGKVYFVQRIESQNVNDLNGQNVTFSGKIAHDIGTTQSVIVRITKANALDSFNTVTTISQQTISVTSGVTTSFTLTALLGSTDANNGLGVEIEFNIGAVSSKNIGVSDLQLEAGPTATPFERRPIGTELALAQRYYYLHARGVSSPISQAGWYASTLFQGAASFPVAMRVAPDIEYSSGTNYYVLYWNSTSLQITAPYSGGLYRSTTNFQWDLSISGGLAGAVGSLRCNNASAYVAFTAEL